jgi:hypothetical protein
MLQDFRENKHGSLDYVTDIGLVCLNTPQIEDRP